jgi:AcrR family transcriptional regulator
MHKEAKQQLRLTREQWLERSLEMLATTRGRMRIDELVKSLGVTKGNFYWHFKDKADFVKSQLDYWESTTTRNVIEEMEKHRDEEPTMQLLALMKLLSNKEFCDHDIAIRNMVISDGTVATKVALVDKMRLDYVTHLFSEIGFTGKDLEARVHLFAVFHSLREGFLGKKMTNSEDDLMARFKFFIAKCSDTQKSDS